MKKKKRSAAVSSHVSLTARPARAVQRRGGPCTRRKPALTGLGAPFRGPENGLGVAFGFPFKPQGHISFTVSLERSIAICPDQVIRSTGSCLPLFAACDTSLNTSFSKMPSYTVAAFDNLEVIKSQSKPWSTQNHAKNYTGYPHPFEVGTVPY